MQVTLCKNEKELLSSAIEQTLGNLQQQFKDISASINEVRSLQIAFRECLKNQDTLEINDNIRKYIFKLIRPLPLMQVETLITKIGFHESTKYS